MPSDIPQHGDVALLVADDVLRPILTQMQENAYDAHLVFCAVLMLSKTRTLPSTTAGGTGSRRRA